ncbi:tryptophan-rich sensory protein [Sphingomonas naphthae]|uniref:Tryptophan-rich sensory protein n=1 Tax=Sphingomonas naphthae TaxID=1813468 RepID=A0ABY7TJW8_9SPHN|nr:tryptophan-rich sensory protein [Sphingomonas naphthae]WCT73251.1 tryptophan-rich sensory protein [Sphingomonas naphthae]
MVRPDMPRILLTLILALAQIAATFLPLAGVGETIGTRSAEAPSLLTPPGWAFAIWGPIYLATIAYAVWQALPANRASPRIARIGWWMVGALALNTLWPLVFQLQGSKGWSVLVIFALLACLLVAVRKVGLIGARDPDQYLVALPVGLFGGWVMAASVLNMTSWLGNVAEVPLPAMAPEAWVAFLAILLGLLGAVTVVRSANLWFGLALLWALGGIAATAGATGNRLGLMAAGVAALLLLLGGVASIRVGKKAMR